MVFFLFWRGVKFRQYGAANIKTDYIFVFKKPKPGDLQYAELAEFSTGQGGQRSSLSPTNRHTETQYADVNAM